MATSVRAPASVSLSSGPHPKSPAKKTGESDRPSATPVKATAVAKSTLSDFVERSASVQEFHCCTNETRQAVVQRYFQLSPSSGNAIYGCGGFCILNLGSLDPKITRYAAFDLSPKMEEFWVGKMEKIMTEPKLTLETATERIFTILNPRDQTMLEAEIDKGESWLCDEDRFGRVHRAYLSGLVSFTRLDAGNIPQFCSFLVAQTRRGSVPRAVYISNIAEVRTTGALIESHPERYKSFSRCLQLIPHTAAVIDAVTLREGSHAEQRLHEPVTTAEMPRDFYLPVPTSIYEKGLLEDDYESVRFGLVNGVNPKRKDSSGVTDLMKMADRGNVHAMRALIEGGAELEAEDTEGHRAIHFAAIALKNQKAAIELLHAHRANLNAGDHQRMSPLHHATAKAQTVAVETLLACGADRTERDLLRCTPLMYLERPNFTICKMRGQPAYTRIKALLESPSSPSISSPEDAKTPKPKKEEKKA